MARRKSEAFGIKDGQFRGQWKDRESFCSWLCQELDIAISGRGSAQQDVRLAWDYYEQARMRGSNSPWPDAADLPSPYAAEYTDALHARLMQSIFVEPIWHVEGWGQSAARAPFVEEFHQRAQEDERFQDYADEWVLRGLIEGVGTLEVSESVEWRMERQRKRVALQVSEDGAPILGEDNQPLLQMDEAGQYIEASDPSMASVDAELDVPEPIRVGPAYDVIPYMDFGPLPAHARNRTQVWGYWKRFWRRVPELEARAKDGVYDADAVKAIGTDNERSNNSDEAPKGPVPVSQDGMTAQKELFEVPLLADLDGTGERWWRATLHKDRRQLLRLVHDDHVTRYIRWYPYPKPGTVDRGYSLITHKLITVLEEDTAVRNMTADRMAMVVGQPLKVLSGALWDPYEQPLGPRSVVTVRAMNEIEPMQGITDVSASLFNWRTGIRSDADRLIGQNDVAQGQISEEKRTLGEVQLVAGYAEVRTNVLIKRMQEPLEELGQARHTIWLRTLRANPHMPMRRSMVIGQGSKGALGIETDGVWTDQQITADMLEGTFWFKPRGSVETADLNRQRQDFIGWMQALPALMQINPALGMIFRTMPAAKSLADTMLKVFRVQDRQSFLGSEAKDVFAVMEEQQRMAQDPRMQVLQALAGGMGGGMGAGGMAPGGPPQAGAEQAPPQGPPMGGMGVM